MPQQLIFTSAIRGLRPGSTGYCTVCRSQGMREMLETKLEQLSTFQHQRIQLQPQIAAHRIVDVRGSLYHVLSRISDAGLDHTSRTNFIAHHLVFQPFELNGLPDPATILLHWSGWYTQWRGEPGPSQDLDIMSSMAESCPRSPSPMQSPTAWIAATGNHAYAHLLIPASGLATAALIVQPGAELHELLPLFSETLCRSAGDGYSITPPAWQVPFTTWLQPQDAPRDFRWFGTWSPQASLPANSSSLVLDLPQRHFPAPPIVPAPVSAPSPLSRVAFARPAQAVPGTGHVPAGHNDAETSAEFSSTFGPNGLPGTRRPQHSSGDMPPRKKLDPVVLCLAVLGILAVGSLIVVYLQSKALKQPDSAPATTQNAPPLPSATSTNAVAAEQKQQFPTEPAFIPVPPPLSIEEIKSVPVSSSAVPDAVPATLPSTALSQTKLEALLEKLDSLALSDAEKLKLRNQLKDAQYIQQHPDIVAYIELHYEESKAKLETLLKNLALPSAGSYLYFCNPTKAGAKSYFQYNIRLPLNYSEIRQILFESHYDKSTALFEMDPGSQNPARLLNDNAAPLFITEHNILELKWAKRDDTPIKLKLNGKFSLFIQTTFTALDALPATDFVKIKRIKNSALRVELQKNLISWLKDKNYFCILSKEKNVPYNLADYRLIAIRKDNSMPDLAYAPGSTDLELPDIRGIRADIEFQKGELEKARKENETAKAAQDKNNIITRTKELAGKLADGQDVDDPALHGLITKSPLTSKSFREYIQNYPPAISKVRETLFKYLQSVCRDVGKSVKDADITVKNEKIEFPELPDDGINPEQFLSYTKKLKQYSDNIDRLERDSKTNIFINKYTAKEFAQKWVEIFSSIDNTKQNAIKLREGIDGLLSVKTFDEATIVPAINIAEMKKVLNDLEAKLKKYLELETTNGLLKYYELYVVPVPKGDESFSLTDTATVYQPLRLIEFTVAPASTAPAASK